MTTSSPKSQKGPTKKSEKPNLGKERAMNIFETIAAVMADIGAVGKTSRNQQQGFMFRGIDAVMNALAPALTKNKCFVVPEILEQIREERQSTKGNMLIYSICKIKYTFYAEDGSCVSAIVIGEGMDSGDKATNKAMSIAFKYACFQVFCIPTEEMQDDPDKECHEVKKKEQPENVHITAADATALMEKCIADKVPAELICEWYKVDTLNNLTVKQHAQLIANWNAAVEKAEQRRSAKTTN